MGIVVAWVVGSRFCTVAEVSNVNKFDCIGILVSSQQVSSNGFLEIHKIVENKQINKRETIAANEPQTKNNHQFTSAEFALIQSNNLCALSRTIWFDNK
jgi:phosphoribosylaminoimidazole (AIR) synthetase